MARTTKSLFGGRITFERGTIGVAKPSRFALLRVFGLFFGMGWLGNTIAPFFGAEFSAGLLTLTFRSRTFRETVLYIRIGQKVNRLQKDANGRMVKGPDGRPIVLGQDRLWGILLNSEHLVRIVGTLLGREYMTGTHEKKALFGAVRHVRNVPPEESPNPVMESLYIFGRNVGTVL